MLLPVLRPPSWVTATEQAAVPLELLLSDGRGSQAESCLVCSDEGLSLQGMYIFLHTVKGTPFETPDQGKARLLTHWEQMDYGVQFTASRKFLTITPIVL